jgi:hypothetical protein
VEEEQRKIKRKWARNIGIALILITWMIWGVIFTIPFLELGFKKAAILTTVLLIATNIFYVGVFLLGKELAAKYNVLKWIKNWWRKRRNR